MSWLIHVHSWTSAHLKPWTTQDVITPCSSHSCLTDPNLLLWKTLKSGAQFSIPLSPPPPPTPTHTHTHTFTPHHHQGSNRLHAFLGRHERMRRSRCKAAGAMAPLMAEACHHSVNRVERDEALRRQTTRASEEEEVHELYDGLRAQKRPPPGALQGILAEPEPRRPSRPSACRYWLGRREELWTPRSASSQPWRWRSRGRRRRRWRSWACSVASWSPSSLPSNGSGWPSTGGLVLLRSGLPPSGRRRGS